MDNTSWYCLMQDLGINLDHNIDDIIQGKCDLVVPRMIAVINTVSRCLDGSWMIKLIDPSSKNGILAYVGKEIETLHEGLLVEGNTILLENCSIFINKKPFSRMINIVQRNLIAIYTSPKIELRVIDNNSNTILNDDNNYVNDNDVNIAVVNDNKSQENIITKKKKSID